MLIYNHEKELIGIDSADLEKLGFTNLTQLLSEVSDFADLFVKKAGFIHNFQHVHWIDFVNTASDVDTTSEVIIKIKDKEYQAQLEITSIYLKDEPSLPAFIVYLQKLRDLSSTDIINDEEEDENTAIFDIENITQIEPIAPQNNKNENLEIFPEKITIDINDEVDDIEEDTYIYNPELASQELGLSVDIVEEFIQDFIKQANDFKSQIYLSLETNDLEDIKKRTHKLRGISANLRLDEIFELLTFIKNSEDKEDIKKSLDDIYKKIDSISIHINTPPQEIEEFSDDIFLEITPEAEKKEKDIILDYDKEAVAKELGISLKNFEELFNDFLIETDKLTKAIEKSILNNNSDSWIVEAIKLKGISENMHFYNFIDNLNEIIKTKDTAVAKKNIEKITTTLQA